MKKKNPLEEFEAEFEKVHEEEPTAHQIIQKQLDEGYYQKEPTGFDIEPDTDDKGQASLFTPEVMKDVDVFERAKSKLSLKERESDMIEQGKRFKPDPMYKDGVDFPEVKYVAGVDPYDGRKHDKFFLDEVGQMGDGVRRVQSPELVREMLRFAEHYGTSITGETQKVWVGVDPGKSGGIVALTDKGIIGKWTIPLIGDDVDPVGIWEILHNLHDNYHATVILEEVHSLHKMAAKTNFSMGHTLGIILGVIVSLRMRLIRTQPKAWQKEVWITSEIEYQPIKPGQKRPSVDTKLTSLKAAHRLFPGEDFRKSARAKVPHDGIIDAVCMAEFGRRKNL